MGEWMNFIYFDGGLLNMGRDIKELTGHEKVFYFDQSTDN